MTNNAAKRLPNNFLDPEEITKKHPRLMAGTLPPDAKKPVDPTPDAYTGRTRAYETGQDFMEIARIDTDPQVRQHFDEEAERNMAESIKVHGVQQPISLRWDQERGKHIVIAGERRLRAAQQAGLTKVPATFYNADDLTEDKITELQLVENIHRENLNPIELANALVKLMDALKLDAKQLAERLHMSQPQVTRTLALRRLPEEIQKHVATGRLSQRSAYELSKLDNEDAQRRLTDQALTKELDHHQIGKSVRQLKGKRSRQTSTRITLSFFPEADNKKDKVTVTANDGETYHDVRRRLLTTLTEVEHRIANGVAL